MVFKIKNKKVGRQNLKLSRKQQRKEKRNEKKIRRNEYYTKRKKLETHVLNSDNISPTVDDVVNKVHKNIHKTTKNPEAKPSNMVLTTEQIRKKEQKEQNKLKKEMIKQRNKQLLEANFDEDRNIRRLEKQLKLNKRKSKTVPKSFSEDGLDYLLEVCDTEGMKNITSAEQGLNEINDEFEEDFALMTEKTEDIIKKDMHNDVDSFDSEDENDKESDIFESDIEIEHEASEEDGTENNNDESDQSEISDLEKIEEEKEIKKKLNKQTKKRKEEISTNPSTKRKIENSILIKGKKQKLKNFDSGDEQSTDEENFNDDILSDNQESQNSEDENEIKGAMKKNADGTWEDIYGRLRDKNGAIIKSKESRYIPPAIRVKLESKSSVDKKKLEKLDRIKKQLKGLLNRLAESNMYNISSQIEELYMKNSRSDINETLTTLMMESLISEVITPERLLIEHVVLVTILHANVGTEVGAHYLQIIIKRFDECMNMSYDVENKSLDNIVNIISQLYNFKLFDSKLLYEVINRLSNNFDEKNVECILHILRSVGFTLRKDDPLTLKNLILDLQKRAADASDEVRDNPRVKFMLDILLAIKNNNVTKIPNYDTSYSEHLKKIMKGFIRKGNYVSQLNISLDDLLNAEEKGKWWVVGSAWTGTSTSENKEIPKEIKKLEGFPEKLLALAKKQRMNTDTRRNIFCIIMSAEDYLDAFEKLLHLGLKNQQEREIINVILQCCLQEKVYNPYYAVLTQKFCEYDRKYQMIIKYSVWDKLKALGEHSGSQISNLAKMLIHLFIEKSLPISTLKIVQFSELDKITLRFMRQILLGILLHKDLEACLSVFEKVSQSEKLKLFRESLRLFIHHFLLKNLTSDGISDNNRSLLETRAKMVEKVLVAKESKTKF